jgi:hypothetical protein
MRMSSGRRAPRVALLGAGLVVGTLTITIPTSHTAAPELSAAQREMVAQRSRVRAAVLLKEAVDAGAPAGYAGLTIEPTGTALHWKGGRAALSLRLAAALAEAQKIAPVFVVSAKYSRDDLRAAAARLRAQLGPDSPVHTIKDLGTGMGLRVAVAPSVGKARLTGALPDVGVDVEIEVAEEMKPISRNDDQAPWSGGAVIVNTRGFLCTAGFGVLAGGRPAVLTAGHCAIQVGDVFNDGSGERIGTVSQKTNHDQLIIPTSTTSNRIYIGSRQSNTTKRVSDWEPCFIGELLCQSGVTTAEAIGSELCRLRVVSFDMDSESLVEATQIDGQQGARPGDSGGPLYSDQGSSVIAKGTMTRVAGPNVGFQDVATANQDFGGIQIPGAVDPGAAVQLFQHCDFGGWQANFNNTGNVSTAQIVAAGGVDNDASSIRIASGFRVILFNGNNQTDRSVSLTGNTACLVGQGFNDIVSSMRIERVSDTGGVVFFQNSNFGGAQSQALARGDYTLAALQARGFQNDWASSARVPAGFTVTMFQHDGFTGTSWTLAADTPTFSALSPNANDQVSSVRIR